MHGDFRTVRLRALLDGLARDAVEGALTIVDARGARHEVLLRGGRPVAAKVSGRFDPLLARLRDQGAIDDATHRAALARLASTERRAGEVVRALGVEEGVVREALSAQLRAALEVLARRVDGSGATFELRRRPVLAAEIAARLPPERGRSPRREHPPRVLDRATFRRLARELHPDRGAALSPTERAANERKLAELTARWHRLA